MVMLMLMLLVWRWYLYIYGSGVVMVVAAVVAALHDNVLSMWMACLHDHILAPREGGTSVFGGHGVGLYHSRALLWLGSAGGGEGGGVVVRDLDHGRPGSARVGPSRHRTRPTAMLPTAPKPQSRTLPEHTSYTHTPQPHLNQIYETKL